MLAVTGYFILGFTDKNAVYIFTKPDNVPIIIMTIQNTPPKIERVFWEGCSEKL